MADEEREPESSAREPSLAETIGSKAAQKMRGKDQARRTVWSGLGMMGTIGWSVAIPTLLGAFLGRWLDKSHPGGRSWTLALLAAGLVLGCANAWRWVSRENKSNRDVGEDGK